MKCPRCDLDAQVLDTRERPDTTKRRRYECPKGHRFSTIEAVADRVDGQHGRPLLARIRSLVKGATT